MSDVTPPQSSEEYIALFRQLAGITSAAMDYLESQHRIPLASLDRIAQNVETLACLRGDSGIYDSTRPEGLAAYQNEMYAVETQLRDRLLNLGYKYPAPRPLSETA